MRRITVSAYFGPISIAMFLVTSVSTRQALQAQTAPAAGATVAVRMIDTVDSSKDPSGKQYRAAVTKAVDTGNGVTIPQGAVAAVTLVQGSNGSGWTTQLVSVTINGQQVAVTSGSASVTTAAQSAAGSAVTSINSVLGGFGHHVNAPAGVTAVATGQRVVLPLGTTLTFILSQPPAPSPTASTATAAQPMTAAAAPAPNPASSPAASPTPNPAPGQTPGAKGRYVFCFTGGYSDQSQVAYFSEVFPEPEQGLHVTVDWNNFLQKKSMPKGACQDRAGLSVAQAGKQQRADEYTKEKKQIVETGWKYMPDAVAATNATTAPSPVAAAPAAVNEYYVHCNSAQLDGPVVYFSDIFAFNKTVSPDQRDVSAVLAGPFLQFLETKYGVKVDSNFYPASWNGGSYPTNCSRSLKPLSEAQRDKQRMEDNIIKNLHRKIVETGWKYTP